LRAHGSHCWCCCSQGWKGSSRLAADGARLAVRRLMAGAAAGADESSDPMVDWEEGESRFSFEDSDRFEEDSLCSWSSEPESVCNNWRGWKRPPNAGQAPPAPNAVPRRSLLGGKLLRGGLPSLINRSWGCYPAGGNCARGHLNFGSCGA
jgi:hypothetical protein